MVKNSISYKTIEGIPEVSIYQELEKLYVKIFNDADLEFFKQRILEHPQLYTVLAYNDHILAGFKVGYPRDDTAFYSWIGGVLPQFRRQGIGLNLTKIQEKYAKAKGFTKLRTKSMNQFKPMMILNLKNGFDISKVYTNAKGQTKIVFEKSL